MNADAPNSYLRDAVMTASPEQLQLMLYDGVTRFARQGRDALVGRDYQTSYEKLSRAQAIIIEMEAGLRHEINPQLCGRMAAI
ncbi:MAG: flagellar export chaperone FliS, partial [Planctomycetota bacterium]